MHGTIAAARKTQIRYEDRASHRWLWKEAPCTWQGKVELQFTSVPLRQLEPAGSWTDPATVSKWLRHLNTGRQFPPPVVCATERGTLYLRDGNHRYEALSRYLGGNLDAPVRVALAVPRHGYEFNYRWFATYGTYVLEPAISSPQDTRVLRMRTAPIAPLGRAMVLVAHPDDETGGCAGLLQRLRDPVVLFATDGTPENGFFWQRYGSQQNYGRVRRQEAAAALALAAVHRIEFLCDYGDARFTDQQLYRAIPQLFDIVCEMIQRFRSETLLVPAYEGGHPDHDVCSFIGWLVRHRLELPVWEMPLYHRSATGDLVTQQFRIANGTERCVPLGNLELRTRSSMIARYRSQSDLQMFVGGSAEYFRPQADYDYRQPPHPGVLNYEAWQWPIAAADVCQQFRACMDTLGLSELNATAPEVSVVASASYSAVAGSLRV